MRTAPRQLLGLAMESHVLYRKATSVFGGTPLTIRSRQKRHQGTLGFALLFRFLKLGIRFLGRLGVHSAASEGPFLMIIKKWMGAVWGMMVVCLYLFKHSVDLYIYIERERDSWPGKRQTPRWSFVDPCGATIPVMKAGLSLYFMIVLRTCR